MLQTLGSIIVSPSSAGIHENAQSQFSATGFDQFGNVMSPEPTFAWTVQSGVGAVNGSGLYTAPGSNLAGSATIAASSGAISGTATVTVTNAAPTVAAAASASPTPVTGNSTTLSVLGRR